MTQRESSESILLHSETLVTTLVTLFIAIEFILIKSDSLENLDSRKIRDQIDYFFTQSNTFLLAHETRNDIHYREFTKGRIQC